ncbi:cytochrome c oxidase assembly protein PET191 [Ochromonadaceae sp. CCMP2298]|nr:cytochrome c oxidase assembly protein PET191 [Ochromonadaceae sp. CCMP2298]|eukprot:CAMPEP_0173252316 /NCGR_PEP_ID=MMETSP1142-20121109/20658_1 /TAXON_ID=483371 /ORGANISM="non described non described, Strain CCMP2298" /LENGTH=66 /DNA_ID=CAMNT_0014185343 /DNA_START=1 /DNA_END=201 /DNA_ORIENTATION=-
MGKSCKDIAQTLFDCMSKTECVQNGGEIRKCMKDHTDSCSEFRNAYFTCKRSGLDMRTRIKGPKVY